jgi:hypothetical protein
MYKDKITDTKALSGIIRHLFLIGSSSSTKTFFSCVESIIVIVG